MAEKDYVLGTHDDELTRLGLQHSVWRPRASDAWRRAGFTAGQTLVDLGCGPGYAALDLAQIVGRGGRVIAIDRSRRFLDALDAAARERGLAQIETRELDLDESELPAGVADGVWTRWVYCFVRGPRALLERAGRMLKPGGVMVIHEYLDYRTWQLSPRQPAFEAFVREVMASWRETGGEPDIGMDLPRWLAELGFEVRALELLVDAVRKQDYVWQWPNAFVDVGIRRLVDLGRLTPGQAREIQRVFAENAADPCAFQITPTVIEILAIRR